MYLLEIISKPSQNSRTFTSEMIAQFLQLTKSTSWSPNSLLKASGCHKWDFNRLSIPDTKTGWNKKQEIARLQVCIGKVSQLFTFRFLLDPASNTLWRSSSCCRYWDLADRGVVHHRARNVTCVVPEHWDPWLLLCGHPTPPAHCPRRTQCDGLPLSWSLRPKRWCDPESSAGCSWVCRSEGQ